MQRYSYRSAEKSFTPEFKEAVDCHRAMYARLLNNNRYLCKLRGTGLLKQLDEFRAKGIIMSRECYRQILNGTFASGNIALPHIIAKYWGLPVEKLLFCDMQVYDSLDAVRRAHGLDSEPSPFV